LVDHVQEEVATEEDEEYNGLSKIVKILGSMRGERVTWSERADDELSPVLPSWFGGGFLAKRKLVRW
jgi:hypothetical protein